MNDEREPIFYICGECRQKTLTIYAYHHEWLCFPCLETTDFIYASKIAESEQELRANKSYQRTLAKLRAQNAHE